MQKVVGSSPISRLREARSWSRFFAFWGLVARFRGTAFRSFWPNAGPTSASKELNRGVLGACAKQLRELPARVGADVEDLLVDASRPTFDSRRYGPIG
jgi:hypothetical protein